MPSVAELSRWESQNLALASVTQCAALVQRLALSGQAPQRELVAVINPLFVLEPLDLSAVYPHPTDLGMGLRTLQSLLGAERSADSGELVRYSLGMLLLRNRLMVQEDMQARIRDRLARIERLEPLPEQGCDPSRADGDETARARQERSLRQLAGLYQDTISTLSYRIQVQGKVEHLKNDLVANRIRALLLAGIRSAVLWHQLGGRRWRLLMHRRKIYETAGEIRRKLLSSIKEM